MKTTPCLCPYELGWLFTLEGEGLGLGGAEVDGLSVTTDEKLSVSRIDPVFGQCAKFGCNGLLR